ncbi:helix-turn-helix domain-containing protein [Actinomyces urogenitalis]|uniref:helix-turn-helix domain-containing protein n=1 Tax=Actinomyces urogenitalis TaxID=103621 RepID=UPI0011460FF4|nr:helix-turn-helix transcriptional regulator [Actinomyces urogenitalis]
MDSTTYAAAVADNIAKAIDVAGLSAKAVSDATGIPYTTLKRRFNSGGASPFSVREIKQIAAHLGVSARDLTTVYETPAVAEAVPA